MMESKLGIFVVESCSVCEGRDSERWKNSSELQGDSGPIDM
jgi:hypothetical protein